MDVLVVIFFLISCLFAGSGLSLLVGAIFSKKEYIQKTFSAVLGTGLIAMSVFTFVLWLWVLILLLPVAAPM